MLELLIRFIYGNVEHVTTAGKVSATLTGTSQWVIYKMSPQIEGLPTAFELIHVFGSDGFVFNDKNNIDPKFNDLLPILVDEIKRRCQAAGESPY